MLRRLAYYAVDIGLRFKEGVLKPVYRSNDGAFHLCKRALRATIMFHYRGGLICDLHIIKLRSTSRLRLQVASASI
jgi:hypothetical protein